METWPAPIRIEPNEGHQGIEIIDSVLDGGSSQAPTKLALERIDSSKVLGASISDDIRFIEDDAIPHGIEEETFWFSGELCFSFFPLSQGLFFSRLGSVAL